MDGSPAQRCRTATIKLNEINMNKSSIFNGSNHGILDFDIARDGDVNTIGVWTFLRCRNFKIRNVYVIAVIYAYVIFLTIEMP